MLVNLLTEEEGWAEDAVTTQEETTVVLPPTVQVLALIDCDTKVAGLVTVTAVVVAMVTRVSIGIVCTAVMTLYEVAREVIVVELATVIKVELLAKVWVKRLLGTHKFCTNMAHPRISRRETPRRRYPKVIIIIAFQVDDVCTERASLHKTRCCCGAMSV